MLIFSVFDGNVFQLSTSNFGSSSFITPEGSSTWWWNWIFCIVLCTCISQSVILICLAYQMQVRRKPWNGKL